MALVTTILGVVGVLGAIAVLLWFSAFIESRQLGPNEFGAARAEPGRATGPSGGGSAGVNG